MAFVELVHDFDLQRLNLCTLSLSKDNLVDKKKCAFSTGGDDTGRSQIIVSKINILAYRQNYLFVNGKAV